MSRVKYAILFGSVVIVDRLSKLWALAYCLDEYVVTGWLSCTVMYNRGISWSLFDSASDTQFLVVSVGVGLITLGLIYYAYTQYRIGKMIWGEVAVIAGSVSNIFDRIVYAGVIDFIIVHYNGWTYPVFNIADTAIVVGVCCMMWEQYRQ